MIGGLNNLEDIGDSVLGQHHAAENALLGGDIVRRRPLEVLARRQFRYTHRASHPRCPVLCPSPAEPPTRLVTAAPPAPFYRMAMTVFCAGDCASNHAVHRTVDSLCRHAARAVRDLGVRLWT